MKKMEIPQIRSDVVTFFVLIGILIIAFLLRYQGIRFGFPVFIHGSEPIIVNASINMVRTGDLNPHVFFWTSFFFYLQAVVYWIVWKVGALFGHYSTFEQIELTTIYFWGRFLSILMSVGTVYVSYRIGRLFFGRVAGILAAIFGASSFLLIENAFLIKADTTMTFLILCSVFFASRVLEVEARLSDYVLSGVFLGLAIGTKQSAFLAVLPILIAHAFRAFQGGVRFIGKEILFSGLSVLGAFIVVNPYAFLDHELFLSFVAQQRQSYGLTLAGAARSSSYSWYLSMFLKKFGLIQLMLAVAGSVLLVRRRPVHALFLASIPVAFFVFFGGYPRAYGRNVLPVIPFLSVFAAFAVVEVDRAVKSALRSKAGVHLARFVTVVLSVVVLLAAYGQASAGVDDAKKKCLPDTRWLSKVWVEENIPAGSSIARDSGTTPLGMPRYWEMPHGPEVTGAHWYPVLVNDMFDNTYLGGQGFIRESLEDYDYVITSLSPYSKMKRNPERFKDQIEKYELLFEELELVKEFRPKRNEITGPVLRIYRTGKGSSQGAIEEQFKTGGNETGSNSSVTF